MKEIIQTQQLLQHIYFDLTNLNNTFIKLPDGLFMNNIYGNLYKLIEYQPKDCIFVLEEL
jgi:hypothetical protein